MRYDETSDPTPEDGDDTGTGTSSTEEDGA